MSGKRLAQFYHELATLLEAGVPVHRALEGLAKQQRGAVAELAWDLYDFVEVGSSLSEAAKAHGLPFTPMQINLMAAGEQSGRLPEQLEKIAAALEAHRKLKLTLILGMLYPAILLHIAAGMRALVALFTETTAAAGKYLLYYVGPLWAVIVLVWLLLTVGRRLKPLDYLLDWLAWHFPVVAGITRNLSLGRFARTFGALAQAGVGAVKTLELSRQACGNRVMKARLAPVVEPVKKGEDMGQALIASGAFSHAVNSMFVTGVEGGRLPEMMDHVTRKAEEDAAHAMKILSIILPILCFLAVIGVIVFTLFSMLGDYWQMLQELLGEA